MKIFQQNLKKVRKKLGLTQGAFGEPIGLKAYYISDLENGRVEPQTKILKLFFHQYGINENWLLKGDGEMFLPEPHGHSDNRINNLVRGMYSFNDDKAENSELSQLSDQEKRIIRMFRKLDPDRKQRIIDLVTDAFIAAQE